MVHYFKLDWRQTTESTLASFTVITSLDPEHYREAKLLLR